MRAKTLTKALLISVLLATASHPQADQPTAYPADDLRANLIRLGKAERMSIFFAEDLVQGIQVPATPATLTVHQRLTFWLKAHCLRHEFIRERFVVIESAPCTTTPPQEVASDPVLPPAALPPGPIEEVIVRDSRSTGSRLRQIAQHNTLPLDVINQEEIRINGYQSLGELLRYVPSVSGNSTSTLISNGGDGTANITLRGLPASNTLVLLNGRRLNTNALTGSAVDLNTLPLSMIDRVEIVKDGVSAIYGSDAIAGVVNVITERELQSLTFDAYRGSSSRGDLETTQFSVGYGANLDAWSFNAGASIYDQRGVFSRDRPLSASADDRARGGIDKRSSANAPALIGTSSGAVTLDVDSGLYRPVTSEDRFEFRDFTSSIVPSTRVNGYFTADWQMANNWLFTADLLYAYNKAEADLAPVPLFTGFENIPIVVAADNPFNPFGEALFDVRRRFVELPPRQQVNRSDTTHLVTSVERYGGRSTFRASLQYARTVAKEDQLNGINAARVAEALGSDCTAPCVPLNILGAPGSITDDMLDFLGIRTRTKGVSELSGISFEYDFRGSRYPWELATGFEHRYEMLSVKPEPLLLEGLLVGGGNRGTADGDRQITEIYAEAYLPILYDADRARLSTQVAARYSYYDDFKSVLNPRLTLNWQPLNTLQLRAGVARGFRAPSLLQLYGSQSQSFNQLTDPCANAEDVPDLVGCSQVSDPSLNQFLTITGGNRNLDPESSRTFSGGVVLSPDWGDVGMQVSVDFFNIDQTDVVESSAQFIVNQNARSGEFDDRIVRDSNGNLTQVLATLQNIGRRDVEGLDINFRFDYDLAAYGVLAFDVDSTHIMRFEDQFDPDSPRVDRAGTFSDEASGGLGGLPDWKINASLEWKYGPWQAHYNVYYVSSLEEKLAFADIERTIKSWMTHNINLSYVGPATAGYRVTLGGQNIYDKQPPFSAAAFNDSYDGRTYDITGRYLYLKIDKTF